MADQLPVDSRIRQHFHDRLSNLYEPPVNVKQQVFPYLKRKRFLFGINPGKQDK
jgi:hypothetical protein